MSQQGTGQREANQTKHAEYVTSEGHPPPQLSLGVLQVGLPIIGQASAQERSQGRAIELDSIPWPVLLSGTN